MKKLIAAIAAALKSAVDRFPRQGPFTKAPKPGTAVRVVIDHCAPGEFFVSADETGHVVAVLPPNGAGEIKVEVQWPGISYPIDHLPHEIAPARPVHA